MSTPTPALAAALAQALSDEVIGKATLAYNIAMSKVCWAEPSREHLAAECAAAARPILTDALAPLLAASGADQRKRVESAVLAVLNRWSCAEGLDEMTHAVMASLQPAQEAALTAAPTADYTVEGTLGTHTVAPAPAESTVKFNSEGRFSSGVTAQDIRGAIGRLYWAIPPGVARTELRELEDMLLPLTRLQPASTPGAEE